MAVRRLDQVVQRIRSLIRPRDAGEASDGQLLDRFVHEQDESAFQVLVERHGPMVRSVCQRLLPDANDADDACQATFLLLARKGGSIQSKESVGSWLYGVACRIAAKVRASAARRRAHERRVLDMRAEPTGESGWDDCRQLLDDELSRLPEKFRAPIVLCYLEGHSREEAARQLGWSPGSVKGRLERGREVLRHRLVRRGLVLGSASFALALEQAAAAEPLPPSLTQTIVHHSTLVATGEAAVLGTSQAGVWMAEMVREMFLARVKLAGMGVLLTAVVLAGVGVWLQHQAAASLTTPLVGGRPTAVRLEPAAEFSEGREYSREPVLVGISADNQMLAVFAGDDQLIVQDIESGRKLAALKAVPGPRVAAAPDGTQLCLPEDNTVRLYELATLAPGRRLDCLPTLQVEQKPFVPSACWLQGTTAAVLGQLLEMPPAGGGGFPGGGMGGGFGGLGGGFGGMGGGFGGPGMGLPGGGFGGLGGTAALAVVDLSADRVRAAFPLPAGDYSLMQLADAGHAGQKLLVRHQPSDGVPALAVVDLGARKLRTLQENVEPLALAVSGDGRRAAVLLTPQTIDLWDLVEERRLATIEEAGSAINCVALSPDGGVLASAAADQAVQLRELPEGRVRAVLPGQGPVRQLRFSPNGKLLVGVAYQELKVWKVSP